MISFVNKRVAPVLGFSSGLVARWLPSDDQPVLEDGAGGRSVEEGEQTFKLTEEERRLEDLRWQLLLKYVMAEELAGASDDALLLLKRTGDSNPWGTWGDFDTGVPLLARLEGDLARGAGDKLLKVDVFYAETDKMTGTTGCKWFEDCWSEERTGGKIEYTGKTWPGTDHDSILARRFGLLDMWVKKVAQMYRED